MLGRNLGPCGNAGACGPPAEPTRICGGLRSYAPAVHPRGLRAHPTRVRTSYPQGALSHPIPTLGIFLLNSFRASYFGSSAPHNPRSLTRKTQAICGGGMAAPLALTARAANLTILTSQQLLPQPMRRAVLALGARLGASTSGHRWEGQERQAARRGPLPRATMREKIERTVRAGPCSWDPGGRAQPRAPPESALLCSVRARGMEAQLPRSS